MKQISYKSGYFSESGRSMVEMLGVLAIIGVLSLGGLMGYSYAVAKSHANTACNDIRTLAVTVHAQYIQGFDEPDLSEYNNWDPMYDITADFLDNGYQISLEGVPQRVCRMISDNMNSWADRIIIHDTDTPDTASDTCTDNNTMTFVFDSNGTGESMSCLEHETYNTDTNSCSPTGNSSCIYSESTGSFLSYINPSITLNEDGSYTIGSTCKYAMTLNGAEAISLTFGVSGTWAGDDMDPTTYLENTDVWNAFYDYCHAVMETEYSWVLTGISTNVDGKNYSNGNYRDDGYPGGYSGKPFGGYYICVDK